jgi:DNA-binding transcriptional regulator LsrR (DeoR family)
MRARKVTSPSSPSARWSDPARHLWAGGGDQVKTLKAAGAVGDVISHFLDADGNVVDHR